MISVKHLRFSYGNHLVLNDISFETKKGDFLAVLGPNGVGKSTLFRCILGIQKGYQGEIEVDGKNIRQLSRKELAGMMSYIPQNRGNAFSYSVLDTVLMGAVHEIGTFSSPSPAHIKNAMEALEQINIIDLAERKFNELSGGEQQLVMIARALNQRSGVLMMDEPTSSLDYGNREKILNLMRVLTEKGYSVILSTHDPQHALTYSKKTLALHNGKLLAFGNTQETLTDDLLKQLYGINAVIVDTAYGRLAAVEPGSAF